MKKLNFVKVSKDNFLIAYEIQKNEWPHEPDLADFKNKASSNDPKNINFLVYLNETPIGITGVYTTPESKDSLWLNWYTIKPEFRGLGYGRQILRDTINYASKFNDIFYFRADTNLMRNRPSSMLYIEEMDIIEKYTIEDTNEKQNGWYICTKRLKDNVPLKCWNNINLHLRAHYDELESNTENN